MIDDTRAKGTSTYPDPRINIANYRALYFQNRGGRLRVAVDQNPAAWGLPSGKLSYTHPGE
jgi:hypothetical protein